jgi:acetyltransferase-like isoleucine patch superfamily enzyme
MTNELVRRRGGLLGIFEGWLRYAAGRLLDRVYRVGFFHIPRLRDHHNGGGTLTAHETVWFGVGVDIDTHASVTIRENVLVEDGVLILRHDHDVWQGGIPDSRRPVTFAQPLLIDKGAFIGSRAIILPPVHIVGENAIVGAGAVVVDDVPAGAVVVGNPSRIVKQRK